MARERVVLRVGSLRLPGVVPLPEPLSGWVLAPRIGEPERGFDLLVARRLARAGLAVVRFDLVLPGEPEIEVPLQARRLTGATEWVRERYDLPLGYLATGAAVEPALWAASEARVEGLVVVDPRGPGLTPGRQGSLRAGAIPALGLVGEGRREARLAAGWLEERLLPRVRARRRVAVRLLPAAALALSGLALPAAAAEECSVQKEGRTLTIACGDANDKLLIVVAEDGSISINGNSSGVEPNDVDAIIVNTGGGKDSVTLDVRVIQAPPGGQAGANATVKGGTGTDSLTLNGTSVAETFEVGVNGIGYEPAGQVAGEPGMISYTGLEVLTVDARGGNDIIDASNFTPDDNGTYLGGSGNDTLTGGSGNVTLSGGRGENSLNNSGTQTVTVLEQANADFTLTDQSLAGGGIIDHLGQDDFAIVVRGGFAANTLDASEVTTHRVTLNGLGGADTLLGGTQADKLVGGDGSDSLVGGKGADTLVGGKGTDTCVTDPGSGDTLKGCES